MNGENLFTKYYLPKLKQQNINNIALRVYTHVERSLTDNPKNSTELIFSPINEAEERIRNIIIDDDKAIAITSIVTQKAGQRYLVLLDCNLPVSDENQIELISVLQEASKTITALQGAMLLRTTNSYHIVGFIPLAGEEWRKQMANALLLKNSKDEPVLDVFYVGHSLVRAYGSLRISKYNNKPSPEFIGYVD